MNSINKTKKRPNKYKCLISSCGKAYSRPSLLAQHMRAHSNERPFKCPNCSKSFLRESHLKTHSWTHSDDKPIKCSYCSKTFVTNQQLWRHIKSNHPDIDLSNEQIVHSNNKNNYNNKTNSINSNGTSDLLYPPPIPISPESLLQIPSAQQESEIIDIPSQLQDPAFIDINIEDIPIKETIIEPFTTGFPGINLEKLQQHYSPDLSSRYSHSDYSPSNLNYEDGFDEITSIVSKTTSPSEIPFPTYPMIDPAKRIYGCPYDCPNIFRDDETLSNHILECHIMNDTFTLVQHMNELEQFPNVNPLYLDQLLQEQYIRDWRDHRCKEPDCRFDPRCSGRETISTLVVHYDSVHKFVPGSMFY
ncbi:hypothetical protein WICMUC_002972 [Wickerhamomyces mucosus]|uniref:C2H2-type domain-containing protein n=1 Tax=Wickerhamomyces mucosus TaxID=1378264 RepID=A0A9P8TDM9_9ASCO|nr:hypothetical protein WICMUC_002972 [Wickerhamomyces mucosus]